MEYRTLGTTGVAVSKLCMGTMAFGGEASAEESAAMVRAALDAGINFFDCADVYNSGASEELLGQSLSGIRDQVVVASKGYFPTSSDVNGRGGHRFHLVRAVEASLKRLGTDRIDIYYLHRFDENTPLEDSLRTLDDLVRAGKILYPAASNFAAWQVAKGLGIAALRHYVPFACIQPMYNLVKRQAEVELLPMAAAEGLGVVSYSPLAGGLLSGKYGPGEKPDEGRLVKNPMYRVRYAAEAYYETAEQFASLAVELGVSPVTLALSWVAAHPAMTAPIVGGRSVEQIRPALDAADYVLPEGVYERIATLYPMPPPATDRNEEASAHNYGAVLTKK